MSVCVFLLFMYVTGTIHTHAMVWACNFTHLLYSSAVYGRTTESLKWPRHKSSSTISNVAVVDVTQKDRLRSTIINQRAREIHTAEYVTNTKWKRAGHIAQMKDSLRTIRITEGQIKEVKSAERPNHRRRELMPSWVNRERYGQGQQRTEKAGGRCPGL